MKKQISETKFERRYRLLNSKKMKLRQKASEIWHKNHPEGLTSENFENFQTFINNILTNYQKDLDPDFSKTVDDHFWDLI